MKGKYYVTQIPMLQDRVKKALERIDEIRRKDDERSEKLYQNFLNTRWFPSWYPKELSKKNLFGYNEYIRRYYPSIKGWGTKETLEKILGQLKVIEETEVEWFYLCDKELEALDI